MKHGKTLQQSQKILEVNPITEIDKFITNKKKRRFSKIKRIFENPKSKAYFKCFSYSTLFLAELERIIPHFAWNFVLWFLLFIVLLEIAFSAHKKQFLVCFLSLMQGFYLTFSYTSIKFAICPEENKIEAYLFYHSILKVTQILTKSGMCPFKQHFQVSRVL